MLEFKFRPFEEMTPDDYAEVGFRSGLEIHQQLLTKRKLFCRCPAGKYSDEYQAEILRHMRPTMSELGEYDGTALMEFKTKKDIIYHIHRETVCTYEMDDTPPFMMDDDALDIGIEVGLLLNGKIVDEVHIARKQYLDGSIPTGFQRTAIIAVGGSIPYKNRTINIIQMSIEEDSCREVSDNGHTRIYLTDRLGMPLIETVTYPDMKTPVEVAEVCDILRKLSRTTGKVRTGVGAAREDVNVSVRGGTRIEIKGVPSIKRIPHLTYNEAMRQWNLLRLRDELKKRGITAETFEAKIDDVTKILPRTAYQPVSSAIAEGKVVKCVTLKGFKGLLRWQTQTDTFFAREIADRVRVIACLTTQPNIIHSDSTEVTLTTSEGQRIRKLVKPKEEDTLVLVWGNEADATMGAKEIIIRAKEATIGIPSETRQALRDGTNGFERILPGPERMYPDTDLPPMRVTEERVKNIKSQIPVRFWDFEKWYKELGLPNDIVITLSISKYTTLFQKLIKDWKLNALVTARALTHFIKRFIKMKLDVSILTDEVMESVFDAYKKEELVKDGIYTAMYNSIINGGFSNEVLPKICSDKELKTAFEKSLKEVNTLTLYNPDNKKNLVVGNIMNELRGRINGEKVVSYVKDNWGKEG